MTTMQVQKETVSPKRLAGKVALVTGGSRGIGAAIARRLAAEGASIAVTYSKNKDAADMVVNELEQSGAKAQAFKADASNAHEIQKLIAELKRSKGKVDILVNNAGVWGATPIEQIDIKEYHRIFSTNVEGVIATTAAALELIPDGGRIINITSVAAESSHPGMSIYSASKAALNALTRVWAQELGSRRITVNGVGPGPTVTEMFNEALNDEVQEEMLKRTALGRHGEGGDIASVVAFLASEDGGWVTGQNIRADGGFAG